MADGTEQQSWALARRALRQMEVVLQSQRYSPRTIEAYLSWTRRFLARRRVRDPSTLDDEAVRDFLSQLAERGRVSAATQSQARAALVFFYRHVLRRPLEPLEGVTPATGRRRVPVVLSPAEVDVVLGHLRGAKQLVAMLLYGSGLRLLEALQSGSGAFSAGGPSRQGGQGPRYRAAPRATAAPARSPRAG